MGSVPGGGCVGDPGASVSPHPLFQQEELDRGFPSRMWLMSRLSSNSPTKSQSSHQAGPKRCFSDGNLYLIVTAEVAGPVYRTAIYIPRPHAARWVPEADMGAQVLTPALASSTERHGRPVGNPRLRGFLSACRTSLNV
jgi:hypothetical protein